MRRREHRGQWSPARDAASTPRRKHSDVNGSAAKLPRRRAVWNIDVQTVFAYCAPRIQDPVCSVVRRSSRNPNARSERQDCRIRCDDTFRHRDARCGNAPGAVRSRGKQQWCGRSCGCLRCGHLRWRWFRPRGLGRWHLRRRRLGWRRRSFMSTRGNGQEQQHDSGVPSNRCDQPIHGIAWRKLRSGGVAP